VEVAQLLIKPLVLVDLVEVELVENGLVVAQLRERQIQVPVAVATINQQAAQVVPV
jgi:hypothetical protein